MKIRKLDKNGDWSYGHSESDYLTDNIQAVGLNVLTRLREWINDCFFNKSAGLDYPTRLSAFNQKDLLDNEIQEIITKSENVLQIKSFDSSFDREKRHYTFNAEILSAFSEEAIPIAFSTEGLING